MLIALLVVVAVTCAGFAAGLAIYVCLPSPEHWRGIESHPIDCLCAYCEAIKEEDHDSGDRC